MSHAHRAVLTLLVLALAAWASLPLALVRAQSDSDAGGGADGWFTEEQADRGGEAYAEHCAECHSPDLRARSTYISLYNYPALTGAYFMDRWENQSVRTLFEVIQHTMPLDAPNTLDASTYADITAHVLRVNGFPSGDSELPTAQHGGPRLQGMIIEPGSAEPRAAPQNPTVVELRPRSEDGGDGGPAADAEGSDEGSEGGDGSDGGTAADGESVYSQHCAQCHGGEGGGGAGPALAGNDALSDTTATVDQILHGGGGMPAFQDTLSHAEVAAVATHIRTAWGNDFGQVSADEVESQASDGDGSGQDGDAEGGDGEEGEDQDADQTSAEQAAENEEPAPWFTEEQASRARVVYLENCARCHGRAMQGTGAAPSLAGANFVARWEGESLDDLYFVTSALMPLDDPGSLEPQTYTDLIAYILEQNGFEAGGSELPTDTEALGRYVIRPDLADVPDVQ